MSRQLFRQAMSHRLGKDVPPVIHSVGKDISQALRKVRGIYQFIAEGKHWYYVFIAAGEEASGVFGTLAGPGEEYYFSTKGARNIEVFAGKLKNRKGIEHPFKLSLDFIARYIWNRFVEKCRKNNAKWFQTAWQRLGSHPDGRHKVHGESLYLPVRSWDGEILGMIRTFPYFQIIDGSDLEKGFVLLGRLKDKPERVVIAHRWEDAEEIHKTTGLLVLFVSNFITARNRAWEEQLPETEIIVVDDPSLLSTNVWLATPDGIEPLYRCLDDREDEEDDEKGQHLQNEEDEPIKEPLVLKLSTILNNDFQNDTFDLSPLATPELNYKLEVGATIAANSEEISYTIAKIIPLQSLIEFHAVAGLGKTTLALQALAAVASGDRFIGFETQKRPVVVCNYENAPSALKALIERIPGAERIHFLDNPPQLDCPDWAQLKLIASKLDRPVFLIDTLASSCVNSDIGSNADFAPVMSRMIELRNMGSTIILLNHTLKRDASRFIGAQVIISQADHVIALTQDTKGAYRFGTNGKTRYGHFEIAVRFDPNKKLFVLADAPDQSDIDSILAALRSQSPLGIKEITDATGLAEKKVRAVLDRYQGHHWSIRHGQRNAKLYFPV